MGVMPATKKKIALLTLLHSSAVAQLTLLHRQLRASIHSTLQQIAGLQELVPSLSPDSRIAMNRASGAGPQSHHAVAGVQQQHAALKQNQEQLAALQEQLAAQLQEWEDPTPAALELPLPAELALLATFCAQCAASALARGAQSHSTADGRQVPVPFHAGDVAGDSAAPLRVIKMCEIRQGAVHRRKQVLPSLGRRHFA